jgi:hypothetical protein
MVYVLLKGWGDNAVGYDVVLVADTAPADLPALVFASKASSRSRIGSASAKLHFNPLLVIDRLGAAAPLYPSLVAHLYALTAAGRQRFPILDMFRCFPVVDTSALETSAIEKTVLFDLPVYS